MNTSQFTRRETCLGMERGSTRSECYRPRYRCRNPSSERRRERRQSADDEFITGGKSGQAAAISFRPKAPQGIRSRKGQRGGGLRPACNRSGHSRRTPVVEGVGNHEMRRTVESEETKEPQATLPGRLGPVPMSFRLARPHHMNTVETFQLLPAGALAFPLSSIAWGNCHHNTQGWPCQDSLTRGGTKFATKSVRVTGLQATKYPARLVARHGSSGRGADVRVVVRDFQPARRSFWTEGVLT